MSRWLPISLCVVLVLVVLGCGANEAPAPSGDSSRASLSSSGITVPNVVGLPSRSAEVVLARATLRWRYGDSERIFSEPLPENLHTSADDLRILSQQPRAGELVEPGAVVQVRLDCQPPDLGAACI